MTIDNSKFIAIGTGLEEYFVDKITGFPLRSGTVYFYSDTNRTTLKNVYRLSGSPGNYSYVSLPNPVELTSVGTMGYLGDDIQAFYYPYDNDGNLELYYVSVFSSDSIPQFTREAQPPIPSLSSDISSDSDFTNYISNGQFLAHNNIQPNDLSNPKIIAGQITSPITVIAPGGWTFERPNGSTATDIITFPSFGQYVASPPGSPRYSVRIQTTIVDTNDSYKDLCISFPDVNKFSSLTETFTFSIASTNNNGGSIDIQLVQVSNYGTGGSPSSTISQILTTFTISGSDNIYQISFIPGDNQGKILGTNNDDYISYHIRLPSNNLNDIEFTDAIFTIGDITINSWPIETNADMFSRSVAGNIPTPDPNGFDLYLPFVMTPTGMKTDKSVIGQIVSYANDTLPISYLLCDGQSTYETSGYSTDGIPYARLQSFFWDSTNNFPIYGTGIAAITAISSNSGGLTQLSNNAPGAVGAFVDHGVGISQETTFAGANGFYIYAYTDISAPGNFIIVNTHPGIVPTATDGTTLGLTLGIIRQGQPSCAQITGFNIATTVTGAYAGTYFTFTSYNGGNEAYYVWFTVNNSGSDPAPGGTGIHVDLNNGDTPTIVVQKLVCALNGYQCFYMTLPAGSTINPSTYLTVSSPTKNYYIWFIVNNVGTDPALSNSIGIPVNILSGDTALQVSMKFQKAINMRFFTTPDLRGYFLKGSGNEQDSSDRFFHNPFLSSGYTANSTGSYQNSILLDHYHGIDSSGGSGESILVVGITTALVGTTFTNATGGTSSLPNNFNVKFCVKY